LAIRAQVVISLAEMSNRLNMMCLWDEKERKVKGPDGKAVTWMIEGAGPNNLYRLGFTKESLPPGTEILVEGYQAKDGSTRAVGRNITFSDGRKLFLGLSEAESGPAK